MPPKHLAHLGDIAESCRLIRAYLDGVSFRHYMENSQISDAVERRFAVIGEGLISLKAGCDGGSCHDRSHGGGCSVPEHYSTKSTT